MKANFIFSGCQLNTSDQGSGLVQMVFKLLNLKLIAMCKMDSGALRKLEL